MPSWNQLLNKLNNRPDDAAYIRSETLKCLRKISRLRSNRHVILYGSAFLQKPAAPADRLQITHEDLNAFMSVMFGMTWSKNLTLVLHTPGGLTNAAETIVAYLRSKFNDIEVVVAHLRYVRGHDDQSGGRSHHNGPAEPTWPN